MPSGVVYLQRSLLTGRGFPCGCHGAYTQSFHDVQDGDSYAPLQSVLNALPWFHYFRPLFISMSFRHWIGFTLCPFLTNNWPQVAIACKQKSIVEALGRAQCLCSLRVSSRACSGQSVSTRQLDRGIYRELDPRMKAFLNTQGWVFKLQPKTTRVGSHQDNDLCLRVWTPFRVWLILKIFLHNSFISEHGPASHKPLSLNTWRQHILAIALTSYSLAGPSNSRPWLQFLKLLWRTSARSVIISQATGK